ncbi:MAG TPA: NUDIX hydrolase [Cyanobacteria bacterium UBA11691]|nr:NUDIX hydrolase [Cyanobacteria bacterium UBA11691]
MDRVEPLSEWETIESKGVFSASPWIELFVEKVKLPDGTVIDDYHQIQLGNHVAIVAQTDEGKILMERQYKHGVGKVSLILPGGLIEGEEQPLEAAKRELLEETGYATEQWENLGNFVANANYGCGKIHLFVARNIKQVAEPDSGDLEEMQLVLMPPDELVAAIRQGELMVMGAVMAIALATNLSIYPHLITTQ